MPVKVLPSRHGDDPPSVAPYGARDREVGGSGRGEEVREQGEEILDEEVRKKVKAHYISLDEQHESTRMLLRTILTAITGGAAGTVSRPCATFWQLTFHPGAWCATGRWR